MRPEPNTSRAWMERAESSLALARMDGPGIRLEDLCYQTQQAAEKALKGVFLARRARFPFSHNLDLLLQGLEELGLEIPESVDNASRLTRYAVETRYPGFFEPVTPGEYQEALLMAEAVLAWAKAFL
ncbi:MAG: HEPN domain-containing protein [Holophaga sp.]|nr:HEPN domain-containing protein [Holophaga sp.]